MRIDSLSQAIDFLEKGKEILRLRENSKVDRIDDVFHNAVMAISKHISLLENELHYAEKEKLANWRKAFQQSLQRTSFKQTRFARYRVRKTKKDLPASSR